jgi:hypothetical protein
MSVSGGMTDEAAIAKREVLTSVTAVFEPHRSRETSGAETIIPACTSRLLGKRCGVRLFLGSTRVCYS